MVARIITEYAVIDVRPDAGGLTLVELASEVDLATVQAATGVPLVDATAGPR